MSSTSRRKSMRGGWGAGKKKGSISSPEITNYLFGVRVLIIIIGIACITAFVFIMAIMLDTDD